MRKSNEAIGEFELAQMNAAADVSSAYRADEWDDAVAVEASDRVMLCNSMPADGYE